MAITSAIVLLAVTWFMVLFVVLPLRLKTQGDVGEVVPGTHASAPAGLNLRRKFAVTTVVALIIWAAICAVIISGAVSVRDIDWFNRMDPPGSADGKGG
jgi:predicted secreted protein